MEIASIEPGDGQAVAIASQRHRVQIRLGWLRRRAVHVLEQLIGLGARDAAALIGDLDAYVLLAATDVHLERRQRVAAVLVVMLDNGAHRVLKQLKEHIVQMRRHVDSAYGYALIGRAVLLDLQSRTGQVVLITEEARVLVGVAHHIGDIAGGIQAANVTALRMRTGAKQQSYKGRETETEREREI